MPLLPFLFLAISPPWGSCWPSRCLASRPPVAGLLAVSPRAGPPIFSGKTAGVFAAPSWPPSPGSGWARSAAQTMRPTPSRGLLAEYADFHRALYASPAIGSQGRQIISFLWRSRKIFVATRRIRSSGQAARHRAPPGEVPRPPVRLRAGRTGQGPARILPVRDFAILR